MNIDFLKQVLMSEDTYWIVAEENWTRCYGEMKRTNDHIMLIAIPYNIRRGLKHEEILLTDLEQLQRAEITCNISINVDYPPFQSGFSLRDVYEGYPITSEIKQFLVDALALKSDSIYDYKNLIEQTEKQSV
jgi:hypothetical protein